MCVMCKDKEKGKEKFKVRLKGNIWYLFDNRGRVIFRGSYQQLEDFLDHMDNQHGAA